MRSSTNAVNILSPCWLLWNLQTVKLAIFVYLLTFWRNLDSKKLNLASNQYQRFFYLHNESVVLYELARYLGSTLNGYRENSAQTRHESTMFDFCDHVWPAITFANKDMRCSFSVNQISVSQSRKVLSFVAVRWLLPNLQVVNFGHFYSQFEWTKNFKPGEL